METKNDPFEHIKINQQQGPGSDYFEKLKAELLTVIEKEPKVPVRKLVRQPLHWVISVAASIILLFIIHSSLNKPAEAGLSFSSLTDEDIIAYACRNIDDFDEELITAVHDSIVLERHQTVSDTTKKRTGTIKEVPALDGTSKIEVSFENITEEDILNYLNRNELTEEELEESLEASGD